MNDSTARKRGVKTASKRYLTGTGPRVIRTADEDDRRIRQRRQADNTWADDVESAETGSAEYEMVIERETAKSVIRIEANRLARARIAAAKAPDLARFRLTLYDELRQERKKEPPAVEKMANRGHIVAFPAVRKVGKTTLTVNLGICGLMEERFLGRFATYLDGGIAAVNAEMTTDDYLDVWESAWDGMRPDAGDRDHPFKRVRFLHCRDEKIRLNLLDDETMERFVEWLRDSAAGWLFLDPWKNFLTWAGIGLNDNDGVNAMLTRIQEIQEAAALSLVVIPMHMPQAIVEGEERAKGAGEFEDGADALWRYSRLKGGGRGAPRFLSVEGRGGVGLDDTEVKFGPGGSLSLGNGSRSEIQDQYMADAVAEALALELLKRNADRLNYGELEAVVPASKGDKPKWIKAAVASGAILRDAEGPGKPTWYSLPDAEPISTRPVRGRNRGRDVRK